MSSFVSDEGSWVIMTPTNYKTNPVRIVEPSHEHVRQAVLSGRTTHPYRDNDGICWQCGWGVATHIEHAVTHVGCDNCGVWTYRDYVLVQPVEVLLPAETFQTPLGHLRLEAHWVERVMFFCGDVCLKDRMGRVPFDLAFKQS